MKKKQSLSKSFQYAFEGLYYVLTNERNFKIHIVLTITTITLAIIVKLSGIEWAVLILIISLVLTLELINTAIEKTIDLTTEYKIHPLAKCAKDIAAGAVLIAAIASLIIACILFIPKIL